MQVLLQQVIEMSGKEDALLVSSGTLGNQLCLRVHLTQPPHSVLCDSRAHIVNYESGGLAMWSQATHTGVRPRNRLYLTLEDIQQNIVEEDVHYAPTRVVSLENTLAGTVMPLQEVLRISHWIRTERPDLKLHLDGARLWDGVVAEGISLKDYLEPFDSASICFSKVNDCFLNPTGYGNTVWNDYCGQAKVYQKGTSL